MSLNHKMTENTDGTLTITTSQDVEKYVAHARAVQAEDERAGFQQTTGSGSHLVASIPPVVIVKWLDEGFDLFSAERSGMNREEHARELKRRLTVEFPYLLTSRFKKL